MLPSITAQPKQKLSKDQAEFNKLNKRIENLRRKISKESTEKQTLLSYYSAEIYPLEKHIASQRAIITPMLYKYLHLDTGLNKTGKRTLRDLLLSLLREVFSQPGYLPDDKMKEVFEHIHEVSYEQAREESFEESKAEMEEMFRRMGVRINVDDLHADDSPEEIARKMAQKHQQIKDQKEAQDAKKGK